MKASDSEKPESTPAPVETLQVVRGNNGTLFEVKKGVRGRQEILLSQETGYDLPEG